jgi:hypothetical protein
VILPEFCDNETPPKGKIIYQKNADKWMTTDSLLLLKFKTRDCRTDGSELDAGEQRHIRGVSPSLPLSNLEIA